MPIHKQIHIRLTSSFDKWLQMASIQGDSLSPYNQRRAILILTSMGFCLFFILSFHTKNNLREVFGVDCVAGLGACAPLSALDVLILRPAPHHTTSVTYIARRNEDSELLMKSYVHVYHGPNRTPLRS